MNRVIFCSALTLLIVSCKPYTGIYTEGRFQSVTHSRKYPDILPPRITGTTTLIDMTGDRVVERKKFRHGVSFWGSILNFERITTYDTAGHITKIVTVNGNKRTTIEYSCK